MICPMAEGEQNTKRFDWLKLPRTKKPGRYLRGMLR